MDIIVKSSSVRTVTTNQGNQIVKQQVALETGGDFPLAFEVTIPNGSAPYQPGKYYLDPAAFRVSRYNSLELDPYGIKLLPHIEEAKKAS